MSVSDRRRSGGVTSVSDRPADSISGSGRSISEPCAASCASKLTARAGVSSAIALSPPPGTATLPVSSPGVAAEAPVALAAGALAAREAAGGLPKPCAPFCPAAAWRCCIF
eukprot:scaffold20272_cov96-Isochrysis_galbana.AAC.1